MFATVVLAGCPSDDDETDTTPATATTTAATTTQAATSSSATTLQVDTGPAKPGIEAKAKAELDGREDGATGTKLTVTGGKATFAAADGWKDAKSGSWTTATSADDKSRFGAGSLGAADDAEKKANEGASAIGLTNCSWGNAESISLGKDKLSAMVADGVCSRGAGEAKAAYVALSGNSVMAVGGWDTAGGDSNATFSIFRAAKKAVGGTGDPSGIAACCAALSQNANSAPPAQKGAYLAAAGACNALRNNPQGKAALAGVRAMLAGASVPAVCR